MLSTSRSPASCSTSSTRLVVSSLVAVSASEVLGQILFSDLAGIVGGRNVAAVSLAPMAVRPSHQRQGIGSHLVRTGLDDVRKKARKAVIVLGHPEYYLRFGFAAELARKLASCPVLLPERPVLCVIPMLSGSNDACRWLCLTGESRSRKRAFRGSAPFSVNSGRAFWDCGRSSVG